MKKIKVVDWFSFFAPKFYLLTIIAGAIIRIILACSPLTVTSGISFFDWFKIFGLGVVNDIAFTTIALVPAFLIYTCFNDFKYKKPFSYLMTLILVGLTVYVVGFNDITDEYAGVVPMIANILLSIITICYLLKLFIPSIRRKWRTASIVTLMLIYFACVVFIAIGEVVFWSEFAVRYNFIAVDYLVYTNEVVGNIIESYPMVPITLGIIAAAVALHLLFVKGKSLEEAGIGNAGGYFVLLALLALGTFGAIKWLDWGYRNLGNDENYFVKELQENGCWDFLEAYNSNELSYSQFYEMLPEGQVKRDVYEMCNWNSDGVQPVRSEEEFIQKNIVLITIESLSAEFLSAYGCEDGITPNLDSLAGKSLVFDKLFATGNRTVRGLEAVTLSLPPSPGESIVKRPENGGYFSTGELLRNEGYHTRFIYGGDSYFDNMESFFTTYGYDILDKKSYDQSRIIFSNVWGTCDEDTYREALAAFDSSYEAGEPFFAHIMTISNHRPYSYPEGRIEYDGKPMSRRAAVKYTDWALGDFIRKASEKEWFDNTVFVILADHCASSAGKTSIPLDGYHIPAMFYAPGFIEPQRIDKVCSQIDLMPTLFAMLHLQYDSKFFGQNILDEQFRERAFMATYQDLGYYADGILTVLSPVRQVKQYKVLSEGFNYKEEFLTEKSEALADEAKAFYQYMN